MAVDGPALLNVIEVLTVVPAVAVAGAVTAVETSASGEIAVVAVALSGCALAPWLVVVEIWLATLTAPDGGAVKLMPMATLDPAPKLAGMPVNATAPVPGMYVAVAPGGRPVMATPVSPGGSVNAVLTPPAIDGPALL